MEAEVHYAAGDEISFDYTDDKDRVIWDTHFEFGDAIAVRLKQNVTLGELQRNMGQSGPWGWGAFTTRWVESIAEQIVCLFDDRVVYRASVKKTYAPVMEASSFQKPGASLGA